MEVMYKTQQQETQNHYYFMISMQCFFKKYAYDQNAVNHNS